MTGGHPPFWRTKQIAAHAVSYLRTCIWHGNDRLMCAHLLRHWARRYHSYEVHPYREIWLILHHTSLSLKVFHLYITQFHTYTHHTIYDYVLLLHTFHARTCKHTLTTHMCTKNTSLTWPESHHQRPSHFLRYLHEFMCVDRQYSMEMTAQSYAIRRNRENWLIDFILPPKGTFTFKITITPYANDHTVTENHPKNAQRPRSVELMQIYLFVTLFTPLPSIS